MRQALHIFLKDTHHLRLEILLVAASAALLAWANPAWIEFLLLPAAGYLIARVVHAEAIPGNRQFWITRPYHRQSLLAAKMLFVLAFVNLPILLAQWCIVIRGGFPFHSYWPGLLWSQVLLTAVITLPVSALAALTSGIVPFTFLALIVGAIWSETTLWPRVETDVAA